MPYLHPIEAITSRMGEIPISDGNCIFDIAARKIFIDSRDKNRVEITSFEFFDEESDLLASKGLPNKMYIAKDTNAMYYYDGTWKALKTSSRESLPTHFYLSSAGDDNNSGLKSDSPMKSLNALLSKYPASTLFNVHVTGTISDSTIILMDKDVYLIGTDNTTDIISGTVTVRNSYLDLNKITLNQSLIVSYGSYCRTLNSVIIGNVLANDLSQVLLLNSTAKANVTGMSGSMISLSTVSVTGKIYATTGSRIYVNNTSSNGSVSQDNGGRLYVGSNIDVGTESRLSAMKSTIDILTAEPTNPHAGYMYIVSK